MFVSDPNHIMNMALHIPGLPLYTINNSSITDRARIKKLTITGHLSTNSWLIPGKSELNFAVEYPQAKKKRA